MKSQVRGGVGVGVRRAHLVGSIPAVSAAEAMRLAVKRLGPELDYLPDGETGVRRNWVIGMIEGFRTHNDLRLVKDGDWSDYDKTPRFGLQPGHRLYGAALNLGMFTFGPSGPVRHLRPFTEALAATMYQVRALFGDDVLFQIEVPVESVVLARAPSGLRPAVAGLLARRIAALAQGAPAGSQFGLHLCLGDMNHRALGRLTDASPLVLLANAVTSRWPAGRPLRYVHAPLAAADDPPPASQAFYRPLAGLKLGHGVRFVAGFAHEDQDAATQFRIRELIEGAVGRPVDVSTQPRPPPARRRPGRHGPHQAPARRPGGRLTGTSSRWTSRRAPGHDRSVPVSIFENKPEFCPFGHRLWPGGAQVSWKPCICGPAREGAERGRGLGHVWVSCRACHDQHRQTAFYEPPHDIRHHQAGV